MGGINYEDSPPDCYNDFEDAEKFLPVFGEEKSVAGMEVYGESGFTVKEEEDLAKFMGFFARRALAKAQKKEHLDLEIIGRPTLDVASTLMPATVEDKGVDFIRVPGSSGIEKPTAENDIGALVKAAAEMKKKRKAEERDKEREALQKAESSKKKKGEEQEVKENGKELMEDAKKEGAGSREPETYLEVYPPLTDTQTD